MGIAIAVSEDNAPIVDAIVVNPWTQIVRLRQVRTANQDTSMILHCFVMIAPQVMCQQDMADRPGWFALWSPCIAPWINMVSVQFFGFSCIHQKLHLLHAMYAMLHLSRATNAMSHTLHTLHTLHAKKKPYVYDCLSS